MVDHDEIAIAVVNEIVRVAWAVEACVVDASEDAVVLHAAVVQESGDDGVVEDAVGDALEAVDEGFAKDVGVG